MKKIIALILALLTVALAYSCTATPDEMSVEKNESEVSTEMSNDESKEVSEENTEVETSISEKLLKANEYMTINVDRTLKADNIFEGRKYEYTKAQPDTETYTDNDCKKLTDNISRTVFDKYNWVGFYNCTTIEIVFDMTGEDYALADLALDALNQTSYGISLPGTVRVMVSDDGEDYTTIGTLNKPADASSSSFHTYYFAFEKAVCANYIKISATGLSGWCFFGEIAGYEYSENGKIDIGNGERLTDEYEYDFYGYSLDTEINVPVSSSDADYNTVQNLALLDGVKITASHWDALTADETNLEGAEKLFKLIDGKYASSTSYNDSAFFRFKSGAGRHVVIDLGNIMSVSAAKGEFLGFTSAGIAVPPAIAVSVSNDGEEWVTVGGEFTGEYTSSQNQLYKFEYTFKKEYKARYVRFTFSVKHSYETTGLAYASEFEVIGKKNTANAVEAEYDNSITVGRFVETAETKCENIFLAAVGKIDSTHKPMTEENMLSNLAYLDADGNITDTFMDSVLVGFSQDFHGNSDIKENISDFIGEIFTVGYNIDALNKIAVKISDALGREVRISYWLPLQSTFGSTSNRKTQSELLQWEIDSYLDEIEKHNYSNLDFYGFYWNDEYIPKSGYAKNCEIIKAANDYIHEKGYRSFWCPYYGAYGFWDWQAVGFDFANYQPNYMFYSTTPTRLNAANEFAKLYGMSVELEIEDNKSEESVGKYREYIRSMYDSGAMSSLKMYYVSGLPGAIANASKSDEALTRSVYDDSYALSKARITDDYNKSAPVDVSNLSDISVSGRAGRAISADLEFDLSTVSVRVMKLPLYGSVKINFNGKITYTSYDGFLGTDTLVLEIDGGNEKKTITVSFTAKSK